ncbi:MAG: sulfite exporter TauE/SafE family protein, partial [Nitrososphaerota archaeon]
LTAPAGISGGVLILPLQVSLFHFTGPAVSSTNLLYNVVAIPLGVWGFARKKLVIWPLAIRIFLFTAPGLFLGSLVRSFWLYNPRHFKMFAGFVLFYVAFRLISSLKNRGQSKSPSQSTEAFQVENAHAWDRAVASVARKTRAVRIVAGFMSNLLSSIFVGLL